MTFSPPAKTDEDRDAQQAGQDCLQEDFESFRRPTGPRANADSGVFLGLNQVQTGQAKSQTRQSGVLDPVQVTQPKQHESSRKPGTTMKVHSTIFCGSEAMPLARAVSGCKQSRATKDWTAVI